MRESRIYTIKYKIVYTLQLIHNLQKSIYTYYTEW